jgi:hypothetical protein
VRRSPEEECDGNLQEMPGESKRSIREREGERQRDREGGEGRGYTKDKALIPNELCDRQGEEAGEGSHETLVDQDVIEISDDCVLRCLDLGQAPHVGRRGVLDDVRVNAARGEEGQDVVRESRVLARDESLWKRQRDTERERQRQRQREQPQQ